MRQAVRAIIVKDDALLVMHRNKFGQQYYTLIGGAIKPGETGEQALQRKVFEETSVHIAAPRLVIVEEAGDPFGTQYIYLCEYRAGELALATNSAEAKINALGSNLYTPTWLPVKRLPDVPFLTEELKQAIIRGLLQGFSAQPVYIQPS